MPVYKRLKLPGLELGLEEDTLHGLSRPEDE